MVLSKNTIELTTFFALIILLPSSLMQFMGFQSMTYGILIVSIIIILFKLLSENFSLKYSPKLLAYFIFLNLIVMIHSVIVLLIHNDIDIQRLILSYLGIIVVTLSIITFVSSMKEVTESSFEKSINFIFIILNILLLYGITYFTRDGSVFKIIEYGNSLKKLFIFDEPSHIVSIILPFVLYKTIYCKSSLIRSIYILYYFIIFILIQSTLGIFGLLVIISLSLKKRVFFFTLPIILIISFFGFFEGYNDYTKRMLSKVQNTYNYDIDYKNYTTDMSNLSTLVLFWGYERAYLNTVNTNGVGLGLQQLGIHGDPGRFKALVILEAGCIDNINIIAKQKGISCYEAMVSPEINLNLPAAGEFDGSTNFAKSISEFGLLALSFILIYLLFFFKSAIKIRSIAVRSSFAFYDKKNIFFNCIFIIFILDIFLRGTGYFSSSSYLFLVSIFWILKDQKKSVAE